ncbi:MAG: phosphoribosyltransferase [Actinomycetales bacterium]
MSRRFDDRVDAGQALARLLSHYSGRPDVVVLGLARGGVPVAAEVAAALGAPLDVFVVRKIGAPGRPELAVGAIASGGASVWNDDVMASLSIDRSSLDETVAAEQTELDRRERLYRGDRPRPPVEGRTVILVDDGLATGASMRAAVGAVRQLGAQTLIVAVPTAPRGTDLGPEVDEFVCAAMPSPFRAVASSYRRFPQTSDEEVRALLDR